MTEFVPHSNAADRRTFIRSGLRCLMSGCLSTRLTPLLQPALALEVAAPRELRFGVLGLFHPNELALEQEGGQVLSVTADGDSQMQTWALNGEPGHRQLVFRAEGGSVIAATHKATSFTAAARDGGPASFGLQYRANSSVSILDGSLLLPEMVSFWRWPGWTVKLQ